MTGLTKKLGLKAGMTIWLREAPAELAAALGAEADGVTLTTLKPKTKADGVIAFVRNKAEVASAAPALFSALTEDGLAWFAYPKKTGAIKSDLTRDSGWEPVRGEGFDSVAQVSINETWTGFRFRAKDLIGRRPR